jgi:hypothetical protein
MIDELIIILNNQFNSLRSIFNLDNYLFIYYLINNLFVNVKLIT